MTHKRFNEMQEFEQNISCHLVELGMDKESAIKALENYYEILESIGWDESPEEIAKNLKEIIDNGISPVEWKELIKKYDNASLDNLADIEVIGESTKRKASY